MSERELQRIEILSKVVASRMTIVSAAHVLDLSKRQVRRLLEQIRTGGGCDAKLMVSWCRLTDRSIVDSKIRSAPCLLLVFIDDATGKLMQLRFVRSESAFSYFEALALYLKRYGAPIAFYSDKHSVFRVAKKDAKGGQGMTQFGRALCELSIEILCANSSQTKGRVERMNRTL